MLGKLIDLIRQQGLPDNPNSKEIADAILNVLNEHIYELGVVLNRDFMRAFRTLQQKEGLQFNYYNLRSALSQVRTNVRIVQKLGHVPKFEIGTLGQIIEGVTAQERGDAELVVHYDSEESKKFGDPRSIQRTAGVFYSDEKTLERYVRTKLEKKGPAVVYLFRF